MDLNSIHVLYKLKSFTSELLNVMSISAAKQQNGSPIKQWIIDDKDKIYKLADVLISKDFITLIDHSLS